MRSANQTQHKTYHIPFNETTTVNQMIANIAAQEMKNKKPDDR